MEATALIDGYCSKYPKRIHGTTFGIRLAVRLTGLLVRVYVPLCYVSDKVSGLVRWYMGRKPLGTAVSPYMESVSFVTKYIGAGGGDGASEADEGEEEGSEGGGSE